MKINSHSNTSSVWFLFVETTMCKQLVNKHDKLQFSELVLS